MSHKNSNVKKNTQDVSKRFGEGEMVELGLMGKVGVGRMEYLRESRLMAFCSKPNK